jgi:pseudo-response regulator 7
VRYQSRKRPAEQRPRVRGQFVRQAVQDQQQQGGGREAAADR